MIPCQQFREVIPPFPGGTRPFRSVLQCLQFLKPLFGCGHSHPGIEPHSILLVDDQPEIVQRVARDLEPGPFTILKAIGGQAGLEEFHEHHPALVILDRQMPGQTDFLTLMEALDEPLPQGLVLLEDSLQAEKESVVPLAEILQKRPEWKARFAVDADGELLPFQPVRVVHDLAAEEEFKKQFGRLTINLDGPQVCLLMKSMTGFAKSPEIWMFTMCEKDEDLNGVRTFLQALGADKVFWKFQYKSELLPCLLEKLG